MRSQIVTKRDTASLILALTKSQIFRDYESAFSRASGLPLVLREPRALRDSPMWANHNEFCALMARDHEACAACCELQSRLEKQAQTRPSTLKCFAGMCETAVPVRIGDRLVAFLETGHVLLQKPSHRLFKKVSRELLRWGTETDLKRAEEAWLGTSVLTPGHYDGFVEMLNIFARHLALCGNSLAIECAAEGDADVKKAAEFIVAHSAEDLPLQVVARAINLSAHYFCKKFKASTGMAFTEYVSRVRVEKAKLLLKDEALRISEIAFKSGFQSVSQFNRVFHRLIGSSPTEYRKTTGLG